MMSAVSESDICPNPNQKSVVIPNSISAMFCSFGRLSVWMVMFSNSSWVVPCSMIVARWSVMVRLSETWKTGSGEFGSSADVIVTPWMASVRWSTRVWKSEVIRVLFWLEYISVVCL